MVNWLARHEIGQGGGGEEGKDERGKGEGGRSDEGKGEGRRGEAEVRVAELK